NYQQIVSSRSEASLPIEWNAEIDIRLIETPTEQGAVGIALRVINRTEPVSAVSSDYIDPNLYALNIRVSLPSTLHRFTTFRELPTSFRYDRQMAATGINSYVSLEIDNDTSILSVDTVPIAVVPRLEPRIIQ